MVEDTDAKARPIDVVVRAPDAEDRAAAVGLLRGRHLHGECAPYAVVLHREYGLPLVVVRDSRGLVHAGVRDGDGFRDARGRVSLEEFLEPYGGLGLEVADVDLAGLGAEAPLDEVRIDSARRSLRILEPDGPTAVADRKRFESFGRELTELCRRHGVFIRSAFPNGIVAYRAYGEEAGFAFKGDALGNYTLDRLLDGWRRLPDPGTESDTEDDEARYPAP